MRCRSCDTALTDFEATRKYAENNEHVDLCNYCFRSVNNYDIPIAVKERLDLMEVADDIADIDENM